MDATGSGPTAPPQRRRLPLLHRMLLALVIAFVAAECGFRLADWRAGRDESYFLPPPISKGAYLPHPYLGVVNKPLWTKDHGDYRYHINALGMRGAEVVAEKGADVFRIICVGSSTTFGTGATRDEFSYPAQLQLLLNDRGSSGPAPAGRTYEVLNAGVSGWNSADCLINLELRLLELKPDAILVYEAANDGRIIQSQGFLPDYSNLRRPPAEVRLSGLERFLLGQVRTYAHLARGTDAEQKPGALADLLFVDGYKDLFVPSTERLNEAGVGTLVRNLENIVAVARAHGIEPVLSTFAVQDTGPEGFEGLGPFMRAANLAILALGERLQAPVVPAAERLDDRRDLFDDWVHFNDDGELRHAAAVRDFLREQGLFGLSPPR